VIIKNTLSLAHEGLTVENRLHPQSEDGWSIRARKKLMRHSMYGRDEGQGRADADAGGSPLTALGTDLRVVPSLMIFTRQRRRQ
jgi:hypothetical protein